MLRWLIFALLCAAPALAQQQTVTKAGTTASYANGVQGVTGGVPISISGTISTAGAADTVGSTATFNGNSVCATVLTAGQLGAGFFLGAGTLATTLTPAVSADATPAAPGCTGGNWTATKFVDASQNSNATIVVTNPNTFVQQWIQTMPGTRCVRVCTAAAGTTGSASAFVLSTAVQPPPPAAAADVTDRPGRQLGKVYGSDGNVLSTANTGRLQVDVVTGGGSNPSVGTTGAAVPGSAAYAGMNVGGNLTGLTGTASGLKVDGSAVTQPVSGTVTANIGSSGSLALDATLTGGSAKDIVRGGQKGATNTNADITHTAEGADHEALDVQLWMSGSAVDPRTRSWALGATDVPDLSDRAARLLGVVYGSQGQQLKQTATNFNLQTELFAGGTAYDARVIRALTSSDVVTAAQGNAGSNAQAWWAQIGDTTNGPAAVKAGSTLPAATDKALVVTARDTVTVTGTITTTPPADATTNITKFGGTAVSTGTGAGGAGIPRVTVSNDSTLGLVAGSAIVGKVGIDQTTPGTTNGVQVNAALPAGTNYLGKVRQTDGANDITLLASAPASDTGQVAMPVRVVSQLGAGTGGASAAGDILTAGVSPHATNAAQTVAISPNSAPISVLPPVPVKGAPPPPGEMWAGTRGPASLTRPNSPPSSYDLAQVVAQSPVPAPICTSTIAISQTAGSRLVVGSQGKRIYICSILIISATAQSIALTEGTGTTCGTLPTALIGSTTVANGPALAANGGFSQTAASPFKLTQVNGDDLCLLQSGAGNVSGAIDFVQF